MNTPAYFCLDNLTTTDGVGFEDASLTAAGFKVWPNPSSSFVNIDGDFDGVEVVSLNGTIIKTLEKNNNGVMRIETSDMARGIYLLRIRTAENLVVKKLIVR
jgi:hypothetical protein